jgi:hypothetical protein
VKGDSEAKNCFYPATSFVAWIFTCFEPLEPLEPAINSWLKLSAVNRVFAELFLNSEQLIVLADAIRARE